MIALGTSYKDKITGFSGVATGLVYYISGCNQVLLAPSVDAEGKMRASEWFDQQRLEPLATVKPVVLDNGATPGFDREAPKR